MLSVSLLTNDCEDADSDNGVLLSVLPVFESCAMESDATSFESVETLESIAISGIAGICALSESEGRCDAVVDDAIVVVLDTPLAVDVDDPNAESFSSDDLIPTLETGHSSLPEVVPTVPDELISDEKLLSNVVAKSVVGPSLKDDDSGHEPVLPPFFSKGLRKSKSQSGVATLSVDLKINVMVSVESVGIDHSQAAPSRDKPFSAVIKSFVDMTFYYCFFMAWFVWLVKLFHPPRVDKSKKVAESGRMVVPASFSSNGFDKAGLVMSSCRAESLSPVRKTALRSNNRIDDARCRELPLHSLHKTRLKTRLCKRQTRGSIPNVWSSSSDVLKLKVGSCQVALSTVKRELESATLPVSLNQ